MGNITLSAWYLLPETPLSLALIYNCLLADLVIIQELGLLLTCFKPVGVAMIYTNANVFFVLISYKH